MLPVPDRRNAFSSGVPRLYTKSSMDRIQVEAIFDLTPRICFMIYKLLIGKASDYFILPCVPSLPFSFFFKLTLNSISYMDSNVEDIYQI